MDPAFDTPKPSPEAKGRAATARVAVVVFPGTNCEHDTASALSSLGAAVELVWHRAISLEGYDAVVLPGGFAHGDYLRPGAIARFSPIMREVAHLAEQGTPVLGICNGFQVLTEAQLLEGALRQNDGARFVCREVECVVASQSSVITHCTEPGQTLRLPINHFGGNFTCDRATLADLESRGQVILRYIANPNGSVDGIAAVSNRAGNVVGMMPHPERASGPLIGGTDGLVLLRAFVKSATERLQHTKPAGEIEPVRRHEARATA
ncbi:MAG: phosphoribosylformylglycinamidine synthase subunit PurQ [Acidimicrobiales bacterium]